MTRGFDYEADLDLLRRHDHNFFRLWSRMGTGGGAPVAKPTIYQRTGHGNAADGDPKYDLTRLNDAYFRRLKDFLAQASRRGVIVGLRTGSLGALILVLIGGTIAGYVASLVILFSVGHSLEQRGAGSLIAKAFLGIVLIVGVAAAGWVAITVDRG